MSPIWEGTSPCWEVRCDKCGEGDERHYDTEDELVDELEAHGWLIERGLFGKPVEFYCAVCADDMISRMRGLRHAWLE
jgi:hypothetical protein